MMYDSYRRRTESGVPVDPVARLRYLERMLQNQTDFGRGLNVPDGTWSPRIGSPVGREETVRQVTEQINESMSKYPGLADRAGQGDIRQRLKDRNSDASLLEAALNAVRGISKAGPEVTRNASRLRGSR